MKLIFLGAPGAGKGTQAEIMSKKLNIPTISTGNILRAAVKAGTPIGIEAKSYMDSGKLVPDEVIIGIITERLKEPDCANGYILDGVPRTIVQAEAMEKAGVELDSAISLEVNDAAVIARIAGRRVCETCGSSYHIVSAPPKEAEKCDNCGGKLVIRKDDTEETVRGRLEVYYKETAPLIDFFAERGKLVPLACEGGIEEITGQIESALGL